MGESPDAVAERIESVIAGGQTAMLMLHGYRIGDDHEVTAAAFALTVSDQHLVGLERDGDVMRGTAFFPPELVPEGYRDRVNPSGVVPIGIEFDLEGVSFIPIQDSLDYGNSPGAPSPDGEHA